MLHRFINFSYIIYIILPTVPIIIEHLLVFRTSLSYSTGKPPIKRWAWKKSLSIPSILLTIFVKISVIYIANSLVGTIINENGKGFSKFYIVLSIYKF